MSIVTQVQQALKSHYDQGVVGVPVSVYLIGSLATGEFNSKTSDLDYILVVERPQNSRQELDLLRKLRLLSNSFRDVFGTYTEPGNPVNAQSEVFFNDEFIGYLKAFSVRVWTPLHTGEWKHISGIDHLPNYEPDRTMIHHDLVVTFANFSDVFQQRIKDPIGASKYLRRAVSKFVWMVEGKRPPRKDALGRCWAHTRHPSIPFLIQETRRIADEGFAYPKDTAFFRYGTEGKKLLLDLSNQAMHKQDLQPELLTHIDLQQKMYLRVREGRFNFFGITDPVYAQQVAVEQQLQQHLFYGFIDDLQLLSELQKVIDTTSIPEVTAFCDDHIKWMAFPEQDLLGYYEEEFFPRREKAFASLLNYYVM